MKTIWGLAISLFFMLDPVGNIPVIISLTKDMTRSRQRVIIIRESLIALGIMFLFLFFGRNLLDSIGVEQQALSMAGGAVLFLIGLRMSFSSEDEVIVSSEKEPLVVPIAVPFIAGPGVLAMIMLMAAQHSGTPLINSAALVLAWIGSTIILLIGQLLLKFLGNRGMEAMQKLMGLVLTAMAVQMFMTGFKLFMH